MLEWMVTAVKNLFEICCKDHKISAFDMECVKLPSNHIKITSESEEVDNCGRRIRFWFTVRILEQGDEALVGYCSILET